jgi:hypothetical protein
MCGTGVNSAKSESCQTHIQCDGAEGGRRKEKEIEGEREGDSGQRDARHKESSINTAAICRSKIARLISSALLLIHVWEI